MRACSLLQLLFAAALAACNASADQRRASSGGPMEIHHEFDDLLDAPSTHDLHEQHVHDDATAVAHVRAALRTDSRPEVRRNALVALSAAIRDQAIPDYVSALDDPDLDVAAQAADQLVSWAPAYMGRKQNDAGMSALRAHADKLRNALDSTNETTRYYGARGLRVIADTQVPLAKLLGDGSGLVRAEGLLLAQSRSLGSDDVKALDKLSRTDPDERKRSQAVTVVVDKAPPELALAVLEAALSRGDVDTSTADAVRARQMKIAIPAIVRWVPSHPKDLAWLDTLVALNATCAASTLVTLLSDFTAGTPARDALRALSGHPEWREAELTKWAATVPPCQ